MSISPITASPVPNLAAIASQGPSPSPAGAPTAPTGQSDHASISDASKQALDAETSATQARVNGASNSPAASSTKALTSAVALQLGKSLQHSNPVAFKRADTNGDGKLSPTEARAAGLKP